MENSNKKDCFSYSNSAQSFVPSMPQELSTPSLLQLDQIGPNLYFSKSNIASMYASQGCFSVAGKVFDEMPRRNVVSYNTMVGAYYRNGNVQGAWGLFNEMRSGFEPSQFTFGSLFSCECLDVGRGLLLQVLIVKNGLLYADAFAGTALLGFLGRHGWLDEANRVFVDMPLKSLVMWNSLISWFGHHGFADKCWLVFCKLLSTQMTLSEYSFCGCFDWIFIRARPGIWRTGTWVSD